MLGLVIGRAGFERASEQMRWRHGGFFAYAPSIDDPIDRQSEAEAREGVGHRRLVQGGGKPPRRDGGEDPHITWPGDVVVMAGSGRMPRHDHIGAEAKQPVERAVETGSLGIAGSTRGRAAPLEIEVERIAAGLAEQTGDLGDLADIGAR